MAAGSRRIKSGTREGTMPLPCPVVSQRRNGEDGAPGCSKPGTRGLRPSSPSPSGTTSVSCPRRPPPSTCPSPYSANNPSNARTAHLKPDVPVPTLITINPDRTFSFTFKTPPVSYLLKKAAKIDKGSGAAGSEIVGEVSLKHIYEITKVKCMDETLKALGEERVARSVIGSARSLGINVVP